jgi:mRNA interferase MazF
MNRGEIWWADFGLPFGSETGFRRPVVIVQDDSFNSSLIRTTLVVPLSTNLELAEAPGNVRMDKRSSGLSKDSVVVVSQLNSIDKSRLVEKVRKTSQGMMARIEYGIRLVLGMVE